jgi:hypothetical protein
MGAGGYQAVSATGIVEVVDDAGCWTSGPVRVALTARERLSGLAPAPGRLGLLVAAGSVQSLTMRVAVGVVAIDRIGIVVRVFRLDPGLVVRVPEAVWMLETLPGRPVPRPGRALAVVPILAGCPVD